VTGTPISARFPGQWFQAESGLHQNWMRDYDPTTGRYLQADPLGLVDGASVYGYALQNPGRYVDPTGEYALRSDDGDPFDFDLDDAVIDVFDDDIFDGNPMNDPIEILDANVMDNSIIGGAFAAAAMATSTQRAANLAVTCDGPCEDARQRVRDAKRQTGSLGICKGTDGLSTLYMKLSVWEEECNARKQRDRICISTLPVGGATPDGERIAQIQACGHVSRCRRFLREW
jgi:RHS repeat-associated protein